MFEITREATRVRPWGGLGNGPTKRQNALGTQQHERCITMYTMIKP